MAWISYAKSVRQHHNIFLHFRPVLRSDDAFFTVYIRDVGLKVELERMTFCCFQMLEQPRVKVSMA